MKEKILNPSQTDDFKKLLLTFGIDHISDEIVSGINTTEASAAAARAPKKGVVQVKNPVGDNDYYTVKELDGELTIKIPDGIVQEMERLYPIYESAGKWYFQLRDSARNALGDKNYRIFLAILASTSPQVEFAQNMVNAIKMFTAIRIDMETDKEGLLGFMNSVITVLTDWESYKKRYNKGYVGMSDGQVADLNKKRLSKFLSTNIKFSNFLKLNVFEALKDTAIKSSWNNVVKMFKYFNDNDFDVPDKVVIQEMKRMIMKYDEAASTADGGNLKKTGSLITTNKVWSFYCNLLDPGDNHTALSYAVNNLDLGVLEPVTVDTWMVRFMYNLYGTDIKDLRMKVFSNTTGRYINIVKVINEQAKKFGIRPNELQAILWIASFEKAGEKSEGKTPKEALQKIAPKFEGDSDFLRACKQNFDKLYSSLKLL